MLLTPPVLVATCIPHSRTVLMGTCFHLYFEDPNCNSEDVLIKGDSCEEEGITQSWELNQVRDIMEEGP